MKKTIILMGLLLFAINIFPVDVPHFLGKTIEIIENFDDGEVEFTSYPNEDDEPNSWNLDSNITFNNSPYSLKIFGNTWKIEAIEPITLNSNAVWQISAYVQSLGKIHAFGVMDEDNVLFYSLDGSQMLDIEEWITVYQGNFDEDEWNIFQLPIAADWLAWYEYLPTITAIIFINEKDDLSGTVYFDEIIDITEELPIPPQVEIEYSVGEIYKNRRKQRSVDVQFSSQITDPDSDEHLLLWNFGDGTTSTEPNPIHTFIVEDDHPYSVLLEVSDETENYGYATCQIEVDYGSSTFPIKINFVGDIMLARGYENGGGIIPTQGVEAIFEPTLSILGDAADITVANLECPLTTHWEHHPTKTIYFKSSPENVDGLTYAGIDIVSLANNHILDYMLPGIQETQSVLDENEILYSGAGENSYEAYLPTFFLKSGINFAFLSSSDRTGQYNNYQPYLNAGYNKPGFAYMTPYYLTEQINSVQDIADLTIVELHAGSEYSLAPGSDYDKNYDEYFFEDYAEDDIFSPFIDIPQMWDMEIRHLAVDAGADLVICHHPHIIQGVELYNGKLIAHSLGNFVFDLSYPETYPSLILNAKVDESGFYEYSITPVYIDDWIPVQAQGELGLHILDYLARRSKDLNTYLQVDRENVVANVVMDTLSMEMNTFSYQSQLDFEQDNADWISEPLPLQRDGSISSINSISSPNNFEYRLGRELVWFGNFEDEGCSLWNLNSNDEWYDDTESYAGERSVCHRRYPSSGDNIITNFEKRIKCYSASTKYSLQGYIKTQNASDVTIEIRYYESRTDSYYLDSENIGIEIDGDTDWTFYHKELTLPSQTRYFDIRLNSNCPNSDEALSWFDNVSITEWTNWQSINSTEEIEHPNDFYYLQLRTNSEIDDVIVNYSESGYNNTPQIFYGDVDGNGEVQAFDAALALQYSAELIEFEEWQILAGDVDGNGIVQAYDAALILQYSAGLIDEFPMEGK